MKNVEKKYQRKGQQIQNQIARAKTKKKTCQQTVIAYK